MSPSVVLSLLLGSLYGLLCHAFVGRRWRQLPAYWLIGLLGFFAGYAAAVLGGLEIVRLGTVPLLEATLGAALALGLAARIARRGAAAWDAGEDARPGGGPGAGDRGAAADPAGADEGVRGMRGGRA